MSAGSKVPTHTDRAVVTAQVGREPRGEWWIESRCRFGYPQVIGTPPLIEGVTPFPTLFWLTCPWLVGEVSAAESGGAVGEWAERLAAEPAVAARMRRADEVYRSRRAARSVSDVDPCDGVGIAGQRDPLATKCLHAHVAGALAGIDDPVGLAVLDGTGRWCPDTRCAALTCLREEEQ